MTPKTAYHQGDLATSNRLKQMHEFEIFQNIYIYKTEKPITTTPLTFEFHKTPAREFG